MTAIDPARLYTTGEVAQILGVNPKTILRWVRKGWLPVSSRTIGGDRRFRGADVQHHRRGDEERAMTEAWLQHEVLVLAMSLGLLTHHCSDSRHCGGYRGFPDMVIAGRRGVIFAELKSDDGETTADQDMWIWTLHKSKTGVEVWRPADWYSGRIRQALEELA